MGRVQTSSRFALAGLLLTLSCSAILGEYEVEGSPSDDDDATGPTCTTDQQCAADEKCADWGDCAQRCLDDEDCGSPYRSCVYDNYCTKTAGEPCSSSSECWGDCTNLDSQAQELGSSYCAAYCEFVCSGGDCVHVCPNGMVCADEIRCFMP